MNIEKPVILGSGSWGTALGVLLASRGLKPVLYGNEPDVAEQINARHQNAKYLPGVELPDTITATTDLYKAGARNADLLLFVVPSKVTRIVANQLHASGVRSDAVFLSCAKGIELDTGERMSQIIEEIFPDYPVAALSGPTHAEEVARQLPAAAVIGSHDAAVAAQLQQVFTTPSFRTYTNDDIAGIELGGTIKNVFAIASGIAESLGIGDNARAALVTRGLVEMTRIGVALGGKPETFQGLSGVGDLIVTCFSEHSRNFSFGRMLGQGLSRDEIEGKMNMVAEGVPNTASVCKWAHKAGVSTPITDQVHAILYENKPAAEALTELLARDPKPETD